MSAAGQSPAAVPQEEAQEAAAASAGMGGQNGAVVGLGVVKVQEQEARAQLDRQVGTIRPDVSFSFLLSDLSFFFSLALSLLLAVTPLGFHLSHKVSLCYQTYHSRKPAHA